MATWDVLVNGINLNTWASRVDGIPGLGAMPDRLNSVASVSGRDGASVIPRGYQQGEFGLSIWIDGYDRFTGEPPTDMTQEAKAWENYTAFVGYFAVETLLDIQATMPYGRRQCKAVLDAMSSPVWFNESTMRINLAFTIPAVYWETTEPLTLYGVGDAYGETDPEEGTITLNHLKVGNGFINDMIFTVNGPIVEPTLVALNQGVAPARRSFVKLAGGVSEGQIREVHCASFISQVNGESVLADTIYQGSGGSLLRLGPPYQLFYTSLGGVSAETNWAFQSKAKFF